ncbi:alpha/beta fold hydrolase [Mycolicibacterium moriokaense]|nr:alpha/beta fold hydrolase [Mycolicibacterium moriokaense]
MRYIREGSGRPLLLIHGLSNLQNWAPICGELAREHEVISVDLPGFGQSPPLNGEVTVASLTDAVEEFIAEQRLDGVDVVGSSMGARMVLEMARRGHTGNVVALDPGGFWTDAQLKVFAATVRPSVALVRRIQPLLPVLTRSTLGRSALMLQFSAHPWRLAPDLVLQELQNFDSSPSMDDALDALIHGPKQQGAPRDSLPARTVIGWGRKDRVTAPSQARRAQELFPDARLHWFDDCGHFPHWDRPRETIRVIREAIAA